MSSTRCPNCNSSNRHGPCTQCDGCCADVHLACVGLNPDDIRFTRNKSKSIKILCNNCTRFMGELGDLTGLMSSIKDEFSQRMASFEEKMSGFGLSDLNELKIAITNLQKEIVEMKTERKDQHTGNNLVDEVIQEMTDRDKRKRNLMVFGLTEDRVASSDCRIVADNEDINSMLKFLNFPHEKLSEIKVIRIGKFSEGKVRPVKIVMPCEDNVRNIIKVAKNLRNTKYKNVSLGYDRTPTQNQCYRDLKKSLDERIKNGERNIGIKFVNGSPKIVHLNRQ